MPTYSIVFNPKWYLVDSNGQPASGGRLYTYLANDKSTPKAFYKDAAGISEWPNPIIFDDSDATQGEFYGEDDIAYYLEAYNQFGDLLWTVDNYLPPASGGGSPTINYNDNINYFLNSDFRFNFYPETELNTTNITTPTLIADGAWYFKKNNTTGTDKIIFNKFTAGQTSVSDNPKYYLTYQCTSAGSGEIKYIYIRIPDVRAFSGDDSPLSIAFDARSSTSSELSIYFVQHFGTGGSSDVGPTQIATETLTTSWARYEENNLTIPSVSGKTISNDGDDYLEIRFVFQPDSISTIDLTKVQLERAENLTTYEYETPEINNYRTRGSNLPRIIPGNNIGETDYLVPEAKPDGTMAYLGGGVPPGTILMWAAETVPDGYLSCDGSTYTVVGDNSEYKRLYNVIGNRWGYGENGYFFPIPNDGAAIRPYSTVGGTTTAFSAGTAGAVGLSIINYQVAQSPINDIEIYQNVFGSGDEYLFFQNLEFGVTTASTPGTGTGVLITTNDEVGNSNIRGYTEFQFSDVTSITTGSYFTFHTTTTSYYIWFRVDQTGTDPSVPGYTGIQVEVDTGNDAITVARRVRHACFGRRGVQITTPAASAFTGGEYFDIYNRTQAARVWYRKDGSGSQPAITSEIPVVVDIESSDTNQEVAVKTRAAIEGMQFKVPDLRGTFPRFWNNGASPPVDVTAGNRMGVDGLDGNNGDRVGTIQLQSIQSHTHSTGFQHPVWTEGTQETVDGSVLNMKRQTVNEVTPTGNFETKPINISVSSIIKY